MTEKVPRTTGYGTDDIVLYSVADAAKILGVSKRWLAGRVAARSVPCTVIHARRIWLTPDHIRQIVAMREVNPATRKVAALV